MVSMCRGSVAQVTIPFPVSSQYQTYKYHNSPGKTTGDTHAMFE
jgi:hypothetical protein